MMPEPRKKKERKGTKKSSIEEEDTGVVEIVDKKRTLETWRS